MGFLLLYLPHTYCTHLFLIARSHCRSHFHIPLIILVFSRPFTSFHLTLPLLITTQDTTVSSRFYVLLLSSNSALSSNLTLPLPLASLCLYHPAGAGVRREEAVRHRVQSLHPDQQGRVYLLLRRLHLPAPQGRSVTQSLKSVLLSQTHKDSIFIITSIINISAYGVYVRLYLYSSD